MKYIKYLVLFIGLGLIINVDVYAKENTKIKITSRVSGITTHVDNTFSYKLEADSSNPMVVDNAPKSFDIKVEGDPVNGRVSNSVELDYSSVNFTKVGNYIYHLSEVSSLKADDYFVSEEKFDIYVQVSRENGKLVIDVVQKGLNKETKEKENVVFDHIINLTYITINTKVLGNVDTDRYFKYRLKLLFPSENSMLAVVPRSMFLERLAKAPVKYDIKGQDKTVTFNGRKINTESFYEVAKGEVFIYLKNNQTITIGLSGKEKQLPVGTHYTLESIDAPGWITKINNVRRNVLSSRELLEQDPKNTIYFEHIKNENPIVNPDIAVTGLILSYWPIILLIVVTVIGIVIIKRMKVK